MITHTGLLHSFLFPSLLWRMPGKKIYLTFDDGPHPAATPVVLDILRKHSLRATFFVTGKNISGNESIIKRIAAEGHSLGIHAFHHTRAMAFSKEKTKKEIVTTRELLSQFTNENVRLFRPPFGFFSWNTVAAAAETESLIVMWSCLTGDFRGWSTEKIKQTVMRKLARGSILVFHDNELTKDKIGTVLEETILEIKQLGFEFGALR